MWYWAEIKEDEIRFYSEPFLREQGKLEELERKQTDYKNYMRSVELSHNKIKILEDQGVNVILEYFYALDGRWHWPNGPKLMNA